MAQSDLALVQDDLARQEQLTQQGVVTKAALDANRRQELTARIKVTELSSQITLNAAERDVLATQRASLERAIGFAEIRAPYALRVSDLSADIGQFVNRGQVLMTGEGTEAVDISGQFPLGRIGPLLRLAGDGATVLDLQASVKLSAPGHAIIWPAKVTRVGEAIDARTQNAPVVVRVDDPQAASIAGERPPLRSNMFVEIELSAPKQKALVVPAEAVQNGTALVVSEQATFGKAPGEAGFTSGDLAVVTKGLAAGDQLVVTDPSIAMPGMAVKAVEDEARKSEIAARGAWANTRCNTEKRVRRRQRQRGDRMIGLFAGHRTAANILMIALGGLGLMALPMLQRDTFPATPPSEVSVRITYPGAAPSEVERGICTVADPMLMKVENLTKLTCLARENSAQITAEMIEGADMTRFYNDIKDTVDGITGFPDKADDPVTQIVERIGSVALHRGYRAKRPGGAVCLCAAIGGPVARQCARSLWWMFRGFSDREIAVEINHAALGTLWP